MNVVFEGIIYNHQVHGGVTRIYNEVLPLMCAMDQTLSIDLLSFENLAQPLPNHARISNLELPNYAFQVRWPRPIWRHIEPPVNKKLFEFAVKKVCGRQNKSIWHTPFYRLPGNWDGPVVATIHDMGYEKFPHIFNSPTHRWFVQQKRDCILRSDAVICVSETTKKDIQQLYPVEPERIAVIPHAPSASFRTLDSPKRPNSLPVQPPFFLHLGNRSPIKNFDLLLKAYRQWPRRVDVPLLVIGKDWNSRERVLLRELEIKGLVIRMDYVPDQTLAELYHLASAFIYPSLYEGFGIPLLEAMACGCPVIASKIPSTEEVAGDLPIYFETTSVQDLCRALDQALREGRDTERTQAGIRHAQQFSWERAAQETLQVYTDLGQ